MKIVKNTIIAFLLFINTSIWAAPKPIPDPPSLDADSYFLMDFDSGQVLAEKNPDQRIEPASITKLMTAYLVDRAIAELQQAVKDPRKKVDALFLLGRAFRGKDLGDLAKAQLVKALDAGGGQTGKRGLEILYELGSVAEEAGQTAEALQQYSDILEQEIGYRDVARKVEHLKALP